MKDITFEDVRTAIARIQPVPQNPQERERRINEELQRLCGQMHSFKNESGSEAYDPMRRRDRWVEEGV